MQPPEGPDAKPDPAGPWMQKWSNEERRASWYQIRYDCLASYSPVVDMKETQNSQSQPGIQPNIYRVPSRAFRQRTNQYGVKTQLTSRIAHAWKSHAAVNGAFNRPLRICRTVSPVFPPRTQRSVCFLWTQPPQRVSRTR